MRNLAILGATGSIGLQTLDVVRAFPDRFRVVGMTAHGKWRELQSLAEEFRPDLLVVTDDRVPRDAVSAPSGSRVSFGADGVRELVSRSDVDMVVAAMVGAAGLEGALAALEAGKDLALANKETLVVGGPLVTEIAKRNGCQLLPVDSEHSAVFQCLQAGKPSEVERIVLTASGGPFRTRPLDTFDRITVDEALAHPTWRMGPKITVDSATMMNKALEVIEARWLFDLPAERIAVTIHPQSQIHSFVEFCDGSTIAQASPPDMRLPIQYALLFPDRASGPARRVDWRAAQQWEFIPPDPERYPALDLGFEVARRGGTSGAALNAANETAVAAFLAGELGFSQIVPLCKDVLGGHDFDRQPTLSRLQEVDRQARQEARAWISRRVSLR